MPNTLDDDVHQFIFHFIDGNPSQLLDYVVLLQAIVMFSNGTLDPQYSSQGAFELIASQPWLVSMLDTAWRNKSYDNIRSLEILQASPKPSTTQGGQQVEPQDDDPLHRAFTSPYHGKAVDAFCEYLEQNNKEFSADAVPKYYGKFCSIVQSSGTGKSRLLLELHTKGVVVLYINLRPSTDQTGYPPRDVLPAAMLTENWDAEADYRARCYAFFAAVFTTIREYMSTRLDSGSLEDALEQWNESMCNLVSEGRRQFFARLRTTYSTYYKKVNSHVPYKDTNKPSGSSLPGEEVEQEERPMEQDEQPEGHSEKQTTTSTPGFRDMITAYSQMRNSLNVLFGSGGVHKPKLVIALDDAHTLSAVAPKHYHPLTILCRAISLYSGGAARLRQDAVWVVFASTTSKVAGFAAPQPYYDSARVPADGQLVYPPFNQLGWDQLADPLNGIAATEVAQAGHVIGYGRALWKSIQGDSVEEMIAIAISKLCGVKKRENIPVAVLSQRFCLHFTFGHHEAVELLESSVASHLRVCISSGEDHNWSLTTYPSEPFLSCAAASLLHKTFNLNEFLRALENKILSGMIDVGKSGELASRLLWLLAKDLYIRRTRLSGPVVRTADGQEWKSELIDCQMISVIDYFRFVLGENFWEQAGETAKRRSKKTEAAREKAKAAREGAQEAFKNAFVNFSHWVSMDENISVPKNGTDQLAADEWTLRHWHRTSAVQCCHGQPLVDKMIPIYFKDDDPSCHDLSRVSQIFISDKARRSPNKKDLDDITRNHDSINCNSPRPWVAILVDLGLEESKVEFTFHERWSGRSTTEDACDGPCLRIYASAINSNTFPFLSRSEQLPLTLRNIIAYEETPPNGRQLTQSVQEQVEYGSTSMGRHMRWEAWGETQSSKARGKKRKASV